MSYVDFNTINTAMAVVVLVGAVWYLFR